MSEIKPEVVERMIELIRDVGKMPIPNNFYVDEHWSLREAARKLLNEIQRGRELATPSPEIERLGGVGV